MRGVINISKYMVLGVLLFWIPLLYADEVPIEVVDRLGFVPDEVIVGIADDSVISLLREKLPDTKAFRLADGIALVVLRQAPAASDNALIARTNALQAQVSALPFVHYVHRNGLVKLSATTPNDPYFNLQWHFFDTNVDMAWDYNQGNSYVRVGVLDTGQTPHPDVPWNSSTYYPSGVGGSTDNSSWRHGTHVGSIIGGSMDNSLGTAGICPGCDLVAIKLVDDGVEKYSSVINGVDWAINNNVDVLNMSFEEKDGKACDNPDVAGLKDAIESAINAGIPVVAAAGNGSTSTIPAPASCDDVISVAAVDHNLDLAPYSNYGSVTLAAPGGGVDPDNGGQLGEGIGCPAGSDSSLHDGNTYGAVAAWTTDFDDHCYRYLSGTSMAAPHVTGAVGLILSEDSTVTINEIRYYLTSTAQSLPSCGSNCGAGLLDVYGAVYEAWYWKNYPCGGPCQ